MLFNLFKRKNKNTALSEAETRWNKMWDLWAEGEIASPYNELMTYQSEVNNGGHSQYFVNTENTSKLSDEMAALAEILPDKLYENLKAAYQAHLLLEKDETDEKAEEIMKKCDDVFYEREKEINIILEEFCKTVVLQ